MDTGGWKRVFGRPGGGRWTGTENVELTGVGAGADSGGSATGGGV